MPNVRRVGAVQDEILNHVRKSEEAFLDAGRKWADSIGDLVPGDTQGLRKFVDDAFDLTESVLKTQREFVQSVFDALRRFEGGPAARPKAPAKKAAARKAPAAKSTARRRTHAA